MTKTSIINYDMLWEKIREYATKAGRKSTRPLLLLYYVMKSKETPKSDKLMLASAIAYVVLPIDLISAKRLPIIGWIDEIISLSVAYQKVCEHITPEMERKADELLDKWFFLDESVINAERPDYTPYEMIEETV